MRKPANDNPRPCSACRRAMGWDHEPNGRVTCKGCGAEARGPDTGSLLTLFIAAGMFAVAGWFVVWR